MKIILLILISIAVVSCGKNKPIPASRLEQPVGGFSFVTPDGWFRNKVPGVEFVVVHGESDCGIEPNIFVDFITPSSDLDSAQSKLTAIYTKHRDYKIIEQSDFTTAAGLLGVKIRSTRKTKQQVSLASLHYLIAGADKVISLSCTCAESVISKYEPIFDKAVSTLETGK